MAGACCVEDSGSKGRCNDRNTGFSNARGIVGCAVEDMDLDMRRFVHPKDRIIVEVALLDDAVLGGDLAIKCGR